MGKLSKILQKNLKTRMQELKFSQVALAKASGIKQAQISQILNGSGNVTLKSISKLAKALKVEPYKLLMEEGEIQITNREVMRVIERALKK